MYITLYVICFRLIKTTRNKTQIYNRIYVCVCVCVCVYLYIYDYKNDKRTYVSHVF